LWVSRPARSKLAYMRDKLTKARVERERKPGRYGDGGGLWLQVSPSGTRSWLMRYQIHGRARHMGLGSFPDVPLADARERARLARLRLSEGFDPIDERNARRAEQRRAAAASSVTFREAALAVVSSREATWNREHHRQWISTLEKFAFPTLGSLSTSAIDTPLVLRCVEPIWKSRQVTADRLRQRIEVVLNWAAARGYRGGDNPARWRGHLEHILKDDATVEHLAALPYFELPAFMQTLRRREGVAPRALEFTILTACRTKEVLGARWSEVKDGLWTIPSERMKAGRAHIVPLSDRVHDLLDDLPRESDWVFIGSRTGRPLERHAMRDTLKAMGVAATVHGFRSSFRDWAAEQTAYPREVCEMALAHSIPNKVEASYRRGDLLEKRARLMADWSHYCAMPAAGGAAVVPLRSAEHD
jgi:integrase